MADLLITGAATSVFQDLKSGTGAVRAQTIQQTGNEARTATVIAGKATEAAVVQFSSSHRAASHGDGRKTDASFGSESSKGKGKGSVTERQAKQTKLSVKA